MDDALEALMELGIEEMNVKNWGKVFDYPETEVIQAREGWQQPILKLSIRLIIGATLIAIAAIWLLVTLNAGIPLLENTVTVPTKNGEDDVPVVYFIVVLFGFGGFQLFRALTSFWVGKFRTSRHASTVTFTHTSFSASTSFGKKTVLWTNIKRIDLKKDGVMFALYEGEAWAFPNVQLRESIYALAVMGLAVNAHRNHIPIEDHCNALGQRITAQFETKKTDGKLTIAYPGYFEKKER